MKQSLELKIGQHLSMTPQLQQAIRLLQLSSLDLQQEVQEALDSNPLLEKSEDEIKAEATQSLDDKERDQIAQNNTSSNKERAEQAENNPSELTAANDTAS